jgi:hypothetical protein
MSVKDEFFWHGSFVTGNEHKIRLWKDSWLGRQPLYVQYPSLFSIASQKYVTIAELMNTMLLNISFSWVLSHDKWTVWVHLVDFIRV